MEIKKASKIKVGDVLDFARSGIKLKVASVAFGIVYFEETVTGVFIRQIQHGINKGVVKVFRCEDED